MKMRKIESKLIFYSNSKELESTEQKLIQIAYEQAKTAHAPYSKFHVGCAILLENNEIVGGSNQENASYPAGICAERTALSACASLYPNIPVVKIAIVVNDETYQSDHACSPCGICRQSICEIENKYGKTIEIIFPAENGGFYKVNSIESLLPLMFNSDNLNKKTI